MHYVSAKYLSLIKKRTAIVRKLQTSTTRTHHEKEISY